MIERSFVMMKPDAVSRRLMGQVLSRFEDKGLKIVAMKLRQIDEDLAKQHYGEHSEKPFFNGLVEYITSAPALTMVIEGDDAISVIRKMVGATNPKEADNLLKEKLLFSSMKKKFVIILCLITLGFMNRPVIHYL